MPSASEQQKKSFGDQLQTLAGELRAPLELVARRIEASAAVRAEDDALKQLVEHVASHFVTTKDALSEPINRRCKEPASSRSRRATSSSSATCATRRTS